MEIQMRYPKNCAFVKTDELTLSADDSLCIPTVDEMKKGDRSPLLAHSKFSVFKVAIIKKGVGSVTANIPADKIYGIGLKSDIAIQMDMMAALGSKKKEQEAGPLSEAYTVPIKSKIAQLSNKPPALIMLESPDFIQELIKQRDWLVDQVNKNANPKYRKGNETQIRAINQAVELYNNGLLNPELIRPSDVISIYDIPMKVPNKRNLDSRGFVQVYGISITYTLGVKMPYRFEIYNCMAPPTDGVGASMEKATDMVRYSMAASQEDGEKFIRNMRNRCRDFEILNAPYLRGIAHAEHERQQTEYRNKNGK